MNCPVCAIKLEAIAAAGIEIDQCPECWGAWFEEGELLPFIRFALRYQDVEPKSGRGARLDELVQAQGDYDIRCIVCRGPMTKYVYGGDSDVVLDRCESCGGIWVDKPEVPQLASYLKSDPGGEKARTAHADLAASLSTFRDSTDDMVMTAKLVSFIASALKTRVGVDQPF